jgi:hypothetical protein
LRIDQLLTYAWKYMLPISALNLLIIATERVILVENDWVGEDLVYWLLAAINIVLAVAVVIGWARFLGYRPETVPVRPRLVSEPTGYVPVDTGGGR